MEKVERRAAWSSLVLLDGFRHGNELAAEALFTRYFKRLNALAKCRLSQRLARRIDPEDIVMSVFRSVFVSACAGRFKLTRRGDLWRLLSAITKHKLFRQIRHDLADRRSIASEVVLGQINEAHIRKRGDISSPEEVCEQADEVDWIRDQLDAGARRVFDLRLEGAELTEIAREVGRSERTVRRALAQVRDLVAGRRIVRSRGSRITISCCSK